MQARSLVGAAVAVLVLGGTAGAQAAVQPGETVRIRAPLVSQHWVEGTLLRVDGDSVLLSRRGRDTLAVPRYQVERLQRRSGRDHLLGAIRGLPLGIIALAVPAAIQEHSQAQAYAEDEGIATFVAGVVGAVAGVVVGSIAGVKAWKTVPLPPMATPNAAAGPGQPAPAFDEEPSPTRTPAAPSAAPSAGSMLLPAVPLRP